MVADTWSAELDPALLAFLGPGECGELARILVGTGLYVPAEPPADDHGSPSFEPGGRPSGPLPVVRGTGPVAVMATTGPQLLLSTGPVPVVVSGPITVDSLLEACAQLFT